MSQKPNLPRYIFGLHEPGGEHLMEEKGKRGWIVFTHGLGRDPNDHSGYDHRRWADRGFGIIARLNHGYGAAGTIPLTQHYDAFARRVRNFVERSPGCHVWIIGNEMNHGQERPEGQIITPERYAACYEKCWTQIHSLSGREHDQVAVGAVAPWNNTTAYPGNESGDWVQCFKDIIRAIRDQGCPIDAITLHTYTHGHDPSLIFSERKLSPPFDNDHFEFRCYRDFMNAIPQDMRRLPVYITETDENEPWENINRGWVRNAYREINDWNADRDNQQIRALALYRWPRYDKWYIDSKGGVHDDFRAAMNHEYVWHEAKPFRRINGHLVRDPFLDFFERTGQDFCGLPITDQIVENGLKTQYFERIVVQQARSGKMILKAAGVEIQALRRTVQGSEGRIRVLQRQVEDLKGEIDRLRKESGSGNGKESDQIVEIVRPTWENIVRELVRHPTKCYAVRAMGAVNYIVIGHSAVSGRVPASEIARFHVKRLQWPGIGYHFYIDDQGRVFKTNELTTVCYHAGQRDPESVGICVGGSFTEEIPNPVQLQSTAHLVAWLLQEFDLRRDAVKGKQEFVDTQSPGYQWLAGKMWKKLLLAEVEKAQEEQAKPHPPKPFHHYMLFWQDEEDWAEEDWYGAKAYISRFRVTHGFSADDAKVSKYVTIVGGFTGVDRNTERTLLNDGCRVERIAGKNGAETSRILTEMAYRRQRFLSYAG